MPTGESQPPHEYWRGRYEVASLCEREKVLAEAQVELEAWRRRPVLEIVGESPEQYELRIIKEGEGWAAEEVARAFNCLPKQIRKIRLKHSRSGVTGMLEASNTPASDDAARAKQLAENGFTERQMRMILGCGGSRLARLLSVA